MGKLRKRFQVKGFLKQYPDNTASQLCESLEKANKEKEKLEELGFVCKIIDREKIKNKKE